MSVMKPENRPEMTLQTMVTDQSIGLTTTLPIEAILAAGRAPADLNNLFITGSEPARDLYLAEEAGFPRSCCGWTKGVFQAALQHRIRTLAAVVQGDCSNAQAVADLLAARGVEIIPFAYPFNADRELLETEIRAFCRHLGTSLEEAEKVRQALEPIRDIAREIDRLTWQEGLVSGLENHAFLISGSDMLGNPETYREKLASFLETARCRTPRSGRIRVGCIGVPSLYCDLFPIIEGLDARVVYDETARQFGLLDEGRDLTDQYARFTYPYSIDHRIDEIRRAIRQRGIHCLVHHAQSFCFHQAEDRLLRDALKIPMLTIESDRPGKVDPRTLVRLESFMDQVSRNLRPRPRPRPVDTALGVDLGSRTVKMVLVHRGKVVKRRMIDTVSFYHNLTGGKTGAADRSHHQLLTALGWGEMLSKMGGSPEAVEVFTTGYGRHSLKLPGTRVIPELVAHMRGVLFQTGLADFTLVDIGGQDTKVIQVRNGQMAGFVMNDKCAAGGGRYLENMARILHLSLGELGQCDTNPVPLDITCAVFGETEAIGHLVKGTPLQHLAAGVNHTVVMRILPIVNRLSSPVLVLSGGVAKNRAIRRLFASAFSGRLAVPAWPQFCGALGCVVEFMEK